MHKATSEDYGSSFPPRRKKKSFFGKKILMTLKYYILCHNFELKN